MKTATPLLAALLLSGSLGVINAHAADSDRDGIIEKVPLGLSSYCHQEFRAIDGRTLGTSDPETTGNNEIVDYYGPCKEKPTGKDQQTEQRLEQEHRFENNYED